MKKKILTSIFTILAIVTLTACSATKSNQKNSASTEKKSAKAQSESAFDLVIKTAQSQTPAQLKQFEGLYSNITITGENQNTVIYTYTFTNAVGPMDSAALKPTMVKAMKPILTSLKTVVKTDPKIKVIYLDPDGSTVAEVTITEADIAAID